MKTKFTAPLAPQVPKTITHLNDTRVDNYFWLRDRKNPKTMPYLKAENKYFEAHMKPLASFKNKLFREMKKRIKENDSTVPSPDGDFEYYVRYKKNLQYPIECRKPRGKKGPESVVLDHNKLAKGHKYFSCADSQTNDTQNILAFATDTDGSERYVLQFKDLDSQKILKDRIPNTNGSFAWAQDNQTVFYVVLDKNLRPYQVKRHVLGSPISKDTVVFEEKDSQYFVYLYSSSSLDYIFISPSGKITSETWYIKANSPTDRPKCFQKRKEGLEYNVDHRGDRFYIHSNLKSKEFDIFSCPINKTGKSNWKVFLKTPKKTTAQYLSLFKDYMVVGERSQGLPQIKVYNFLSKKSHSIQFPDAAYDVSVMEDNYEFDTNILRLAYSSPIQPPTVFAYDMGHKKFKTLKKKQVPGHNPKKYQLELIWVKGHDGTKIPLTLVSKKGIKKDGSAPGYLYGYGSYGAVIPDAFPSYRDIYRLVDRGFVYALAHIRGGGELGKQWYEDGKFLKKKNTFLDFISCAEYLGKSKRIDKSRLAICGGSAGGMLMGTVANMRPDLFKVVVAHVPFVDVVNTMLDKDLPLTQLEYKEWGHPDKIQFYKYMKSYSPYDNIKAQNYPHFFVTCGLNDPRVTYWEPAKWVAKLRATKTDKNLILFKTNMGAGHFGQSGRFEHLWENAEEYSFICSLFGIKS